MAVRKNLVLGGSGTIGKELCKHLAIKGELVINIDIKEGKDLRSMPLDAYKEVDYVWFLAWDVGGAKFLNAQKNFLDILNNNTRICLNVFGFLEKYKIPFLFTSSQLAAPDNVYGVTKLLGENWTKQLGGKIVRFWNVYGWEEPGEKSHVIPDFAVQALTTGKIELMTTGEEERQFVFIDDCIRNLYVTREIEGTDFDMTNNVWIKITDIAGIVAQQTGANFIPGMVKGYSNKITANNISDTYGFTVPIEEGIGRIIESARLFISKNK